MRILGISAFYHDSAAALVRDGVVVAAAQEERFTRKKHDSAYPRNALAYCLAEERCRLADLDAVVFYEKPFLKFERLIETYLAFAPRGFSSFRQALPLWIKDKLFQRQWLVRELAKVEPGLDWEKSLLFSEHHLSHAASAFFPSPFESAAILTMDGVGEWTTTSLASGEGNRIRILKEIHFPHSLGLLYSAFTYFLGFKVNSGEYKVMGLAPYGRPTRVKQILDHLLDLKPDGSFRLNQEYFDYCTGLKMANARFGELFGMSRREPDQELRQEHMDLAASVQAATEEAVLRLTRSIADQTGHHNLCLAGGVALNCVANGKVWKDGRFQGLWAQPAAGDAGGALGAALAAYHLHFGGGRAVVAAPHDGMQAAFLGPSFPQEEVERRLRACGARFTVIAGDGILDACAALLAEEKALGWFQSRMEFGPRALGGRSILADPRSPLMQSTLNLKIKFRESFRPFAPVVMREDLEEWFDLDVDSPYMLLVAPVRQSRRRAMTAGEEALFGIEKLNVARSEIPAVTHVDYSARIQTVRREASPRLHGLLGKFKARTGCGVLVNTSFNVRGEPIVCTPEDAFRCLMGTDLDALAVENCLLLKAEQDPALARDYKDRFELD